MLHSLQRYIRHRTTWINRYITQLARMQMYSHNLQQIKYFHITKPTLITIPLLWNKTMFTDEEQRLHRATSSLHTNQDNASAPRETKAHTYHKTQSKSTLGTTIDATTFPKHTLTNTAIHTSQRQQLSGTTQTIPSSTKSQLTASYRFWQNPGANSSGELRTPYRRTCASNWMISDVLVQIQIDWF